MTSPLAEITVPGVPVPQGALVIAPKTNRLYHRGSGELARYRDAISAAARSNLTLVQSVYLPLPKEQPCTVEIEFYLLPLKRKVRPFPSTRPDVDKLVRSVLDSLAGRKGKAKRGEQAPWLPGPWLYDDGQVCQVVASKRYAETESDVRTVVRLWDGVVGIGIGNRL